MYQQLLLLNVTEACKPFSNSSPSFLLLISTPINSLTQIGISGDVGTKRTNLDETVTVLVAHVADAVKEGIVYVK